MSVHGHYRQYNLHRFMKKVGQINNPKTEVLVTCILLCCCTSSCRGTLAPKTRFTTVTTLVSFSKYHVMSFMSCFQLFFSFVFSNGFRRV